MNQIKPPMDRKFKWLKRYLLIAGVALIGVPLWEFVLEEYAFDEVDLFFPGDNDVIYGGIHFAVLGVIQLISRRFEKV